MGWLVHELRLDKGGFAWWWRSRQDPVWNHHIHDPVRFRSIGGPDEDVLQALAERRFSDLPRVAAHPDETGIPRTPCGRLDLLDESGR